MSQRRRKCPWSQHKYLGSILDDRLTLEDHVDTLCKKAHQRMYFYPKLCDFNVDTTLMRRFYACFIEPLLTFNFICWFGLLTCKNKNNILGIVRVCRKSAQAFKRYNMLNVFFLFGCVCCMFATCCETNRP